MKPHRFTWDQLLAFRAASGDTNPLHTEPDYAAKTHFGGPVVFGVLGALAALTRLPWLADQTLSELAVDFRAAVFPDVDYTFACKEGRRGGRVVSLMDGSRTLIKVTARYHEGVPPGLADNTRAVAPRTVPRTGPMPEEGTTISGMWSPDVMSLQGLIDSLGGERGSLKPVHAAVLAFSSYLVGMEFPGERALFWRARIQFVQAVLSAPIAAFEFGGAVTAHDDRFALLKSGFSMSAEGVAVATGTVESFERLPVKPSSRVERVSERLQGTRAWVVGASRGLGASIACALARHGAVTTGTSRGDPEVVRRRLDELLPNLCGPLTILQMDGTDRAGCRSAVEEIGELDVLICNASPPLRPLAIEDVAVDRIQEHIRCAVALVAEPLAAALPTLAKRKGTVVFISSVAVETPPPDWPHYAAAKAAGEALLRTAAAAWPTVHFLVLRPPRLRTAFTHNPDLAAVMEPDVVAEVLVDALVAGQPPGEWVVQTL